jgi:hypothetical protein
MSIPELWLVPGSVPGPRVGGWHLGSPRSWLARLRRRVGR